MFNMTYERIKNMNKRITEFLLCKLMIFKILTVGLSVPTYEGICLHTFVLCDYNQVLCPNVHTSKQVH